MSGFPPALSGITALEELQTLPCWVVWRKEKRHWTDAAPTKIPYDPRTGARARSNDPITWCDYGTALHRHRSSKRYAGLAIMLSPPLLMVDLDHCIDVTTGELHSDALALIESLNTYAEISPSGTGIKLLGRGNMPTPDGRGKHYKGPLAQWAFGGAGAIEFYGQRRMFCWTGNHLAGCPDAVNDIGGALATLYRRLYPPQPKVHGNSARDVAKIDDRTRYQIALKYIGRMDGAVSGQRGHDRTFSAACKLFEFGLSYADARSALLWFNENKTAAGDRWSDHELEHKLTDARARVGGNFGWRLAVDREPHRNRVHFSPSRRAATA